MRALCNQSAKGGEENPLAAVPASNVILALYGGFSVTNSTKYFINQRLFFL